MKEIREGIWYHRIESSVPRGAQHPGIPTLDGGAVGVISPMDRGFSLGDGIFETVRVRRGHPQRLAQHLARLRGSAAALRLHVPADIEAQIAAALGAVREWHMGDCRMRITVTRGHVSAPGLGMPAERTGTLVVSVTPLVVDAAVNGEGVSLVFAESRRNELSATAGHKTLGYLDVVVELAKARDRGADDCLFLDTAGHVSEASASNIFLYDGESLVTPALSCGVLPGVTRAAVLEIARQMGLGVEERVVYPEEIVLAREVFLTNSISGVRPVAAIHAGAGAVAGGAVPSRVLTSVISQKLEGGAGNGG